MPLKISAVVFLCTGLIQAQALTVQNPSFETANLAINGANGPFSQLIVGSTIAGYSLSGTLANWTASSTTRNAGAGASSPNPGGNNWTAKWWSGNNLGWVQTTSAGSASLSQTLADTLQNNTTYTLSAMVGRPILAALGGVPVRFDYAIQLWAGSTLLASASNLALANNSSGTDSLTYASGAGTAQAGQPLIIVLTSTGANGAITEASFDNVTLTATAGVKVSGVVSASAFGGFTSVSPGSWIEIYGANLAGVTRPWAQADFNGVKAPVSLSGTSVSIAGQDAFISFVSPAQVNALIPSNVAPGPQQLTLKTAAGTATFSVIVNAVQPGLLAPPSFTVGGNQYAVALFPDGTYVLPAGAITGVNSRSAKPGDTIIFYGVGFGPVTPDTPAGQLVQQSNTLASDFRFSIGEIPATVLYSGLAPSFTGLYQFNITVPNVSPGSAVPLTFTVSGIAGTQKLYVAVQN